MIKFIYLLKLLISIILSIILLHFEVCFFSDILNSNYIIINLGFKVLNPPVENPLFWLNIKYLFIVFSFISKFIWSYLILSKLFPITSKQKAKTSKATTDELHLILGKDITSNENVILPEKGLYQNILITGAIGSGKTSSAMYPITKQLISYKANSEKDKLGMLILDV